LAPLKYRQLPFRQGSSRLQTLLLSDKNVHCNNENFGLLNHFSSIIKFDRVALIVCGQTNFLSTLQQSPRSLDRAPLLIKCSLNALITPSVSLTNILLERGVALQQCRSRRVEHRIVSTVACAVHIAQLKQCARGFASAISLSQQDHRRQLTVHSRTPSRAMLCSNAGFE